LNETGQDFLELNKSKEFNELIHIGHIVETFDWYDHKFELRTLKIEEELVIGQLVKEFKDSIAEEKAVAVAIAAASLVSINGKPFMPQYEKSSYIWIKERFNYIKENWHWIIVETINAEYIQLLAKLYQTIEDIENLSKEDRMNLSFSSGPLTEQEF
jgi:SpoVK/Ycf46/Vps4 family AAA+-type ATPase